MLAFTDARGAVEVVFTDRHGGAAASGTGEALDLAEPSLDAPDLEGELARLLENIDVVAHALALGAAPGDGVDPFHLEPGTPLPRVVRARQVHGDAVLVADQAWLDRQGPRGSGDGAAAAADLVEADGLVTDVPGTALLLRVADCVPVLLADPQHQVVGAAHAGRLGLVAGVVPATLRRMRELGADRVVAWVGPHICGRCYEVPEEMRRAVTTAVPAAAAVTSWGTPALDVGAGVVAQLRAEGVQVVDASRCTREDPALWSYRRDGDAAGRLGGLVWVRP